MKLMYILMAIANAVFMVLHVVDGNAGLAAASSAGMVCAIGLVMYA